MHRIIVAADGSGNFSRIQDAADAACALSGPVQILIRAGEYREKVIVYRDHLLITGEGSERTRLVWNGCARDPYPDGAEKGTFLSSTLTVTGRDVTVEDLTVQNDAGDGRIAGQAVAVYAAGDRGIWRRCRFLAHQDTLFCGPVRLPNVKDALGCRQGAAEAYYRVEDGPLTHSRQYFEDCFIQGDVDFIFGPYRCWFERCTLFMNRRGGYYTAANTNPEQPWGFVFHHCRLTGECAPGEGWLGRPWRAGCSTFFLDCDMDGHVSPGGFCDWDEFRKVTGRCGEWRTRGERADQVTRHPAQKRLTDGEARQITAAAVLGGSDQWRPD